jgi:hypothetical protein
MAVKSEGRKIYEFEYGAGAVYDRTTRDYKKPPHKAVIRLVESGDTLTLRGEVVGEASVRAEGTNIEEVRQAIIKQLEVLDKTVWEDRVLVTIQSDQVFEKRCVELTPCQVGRSPVGPVFRQHRYATTDWGQVFYGEMQTGVTTDKHGKTTIKFLALPGRGVEEAVENIRAAIGALRERVVQIIEDAGRGGEAGLLALSGARVLVAGPLELEGGVS